MNSTVLKESAIPGLIGLVATYLASVIWPTPWEQSGAVIAVEFASFFAAFGGAYGAQTRNTSSPS